MIIKIKESVLIKNQNNQIYNFYIDTNCNLMLDTFNKNNDYIKTYEIADENVLEFSASIDKKDTLHLIYLLKEGSLIYSIYHNKKWSKNLIGSLDLKSNIYKELKLYTFNNEIHIFYAYTNLINENIWTIEEIVGNKNGWNKKRIMNMLSEKRFSPFCIDIDKLGNIHMVYKARNGDYNQIYYTFYNTFIQKWNQMHVKISDPSTNNLFPYLFVDSKNNIHILWYSLENKDYILKYKKLSAIGHNKNQWKEINLPTIKNGNTTPIMSEFKDSLNIIYLKDNNIYLLNSKNGGETWYKKNKLALDLETIWLVKYVSNSTKDQLQGKFNNWYCDIGKNISYYFCNLHNNVPIKDIKNSVVPYKKGGENIEEKKVLKESEAIYLKNIKEILDQINISLEKILISINNLENDMIIFKKVLENNNNTTCRKKLFDLFK